MASNLANMALRLIMGNYVVSPIEIVLIYCDTQGVISFSHFSFHLTSKQVNVLSHRQHKFVSRYAIFHM